LITAISLIWISVPIPCKTAGDAAEKGYERVGALVKGRNYYIRVDAFNECGITKGQVVKKV
jgi:hypothetical protein